MTTLTHIAEWAGAEMIGDVVLGENIQLVIDSRTISYPEDSIFFAIKTNYNDGHLFIPELINRGVKAFVVEANFDESSYTDVCFLKVKNVIDALQAVAKHHRNQFTYPVIGITGSNGKTIVKEWLLQLLNHPETICASPKSYNSQIGVPLSVWQLNKTHRLGIFEAGISTVNEMDKLEEIIQAKIGILTHLGPAHNQGFDSPDQKLNEKLKLFKHADIVLTAHIPEVISKINRQYQSFGFNEPAADLNFTEKLIKNGKTTLSGSYNGNDIRITIPFIDEASIENASLCCLTTLYLNQFDAAKFEHLNAISMRLELKKGIHGCLIINDSYSNDLHALSTALTFLESQAIHAKKTVILSDISESGLPSKLLYTKVRQFLEEKNVSKLIAIGPEFSKEKLLFESFKEARFFLDTNSFLKSFNPADFNDENILIKGGRRFKFEHVVKRLEQESHGTVLEINLSAALHNLETIKSKLPKGMKIMAMVKAFAYGTGTYEIAKLIERKVDYLAVAYTDEGAALRRYGITAPIMVMNAEFDTFPQLIEYKLEPVIFSTHQLETMVEMLRNIQFGDDGNQLTLHIELDTGMHRLGFMPNEIGSLIDVLKTHKEFIKIASIFSHLSSSDESKHDDFTREQFAQFKFMSNEIENAMGVASIKHISNTAGIMRFSQEGLDMVRLGIGLYGIDPTGHSRDSFEQVFTLKTNVSQIKQIGADESIGYSRKSFASRERKIAVLALGYADGLNRLLSNGKGAFLINGKLAPIAGNVCMDMCMVDVTDIDCEEGDEAILFGKDKSIYELADILGTIPYEILTSISQRVKRIYVSE
ncbi:MAG TPA: bifunctional UDP-N-acetylmuramoyl-tripeptide:D-alanyl-D-alanine ligase/alanine racemase [Bacteroidia bacterium]